MSSTLVPRHVRARRELRQARLRELGYKSYPEYLMSPHWMKVRERYWTSPDTRKDCMCGETEALHLHHKTYARIGSERLDDLMPLCDRCHAMVHVLEYRGDIGLDLKGFESAERAIAYAEEQAASLARIAPDAEVPIWYRVMMIERNPEPRNDNRWRSLLGRVLAVEKTLSRAGFKP